jgi:hypothetical protein
MTNLKQQLIEASLKLADLMKEGTALTEPNNRPRKSCAYMIFDNRYRDAGYFKDNFKMIKF